MNVFRLLLCGGIGTALSMGVAPGFQFNPPLLWADQDTDRDGIPDWFEQWNGLDYQDPTDAQEDPDEDGLDNLREFRAETDPQNPDTDGDTLKDGDEINGFLYNGKTYRTNPARNDSDRDGLSDDDEIYIHQTNPSFFDTDGDLLPDGFEIDNGSDPFTKASISTNSDTDDLTDFEEYLAGTNPKQADSDDDGTDDFTELNSGGDPNDGSDDGVPPPEEEQADILGTIGDYSGSHSERWLLKIVGGRSFASTNFGVVDDFFGALRRGTVYKTQIIHVGSNLDTPDLDYEATISAEGGLIDDRDEILGQHSNVGSETVSGPNIILPLIRLKDSANPDNLIGDSGTLALEIDPETRNAGAILSLGIDDASYNSWFSYKIIDPEGTLVDQGIFSEDSVEISFEWTEDGYQPDGNYRVEVSGTVPGEQPVVLFNGEIQMACTGCTSDRCIPGSYSLSVGSIDVRFPLGTAFFGKGNGEMWIRAQYPRIDMARPSFLGMRVGSSFEVRPVDRSQPVEQVLSSDALTDISVINDFKYRIDVYPFAQVGPEVGGRFTYSGNPKYSIVVENPDMSGNPGLTPAIVERLRLTRFVDGVPDDTAEFSFDKQTLEWELIEAAGVKRESLTTTINPSELRKTERRAIQNSDGTPVSVTETTFELFPWGWEKVKEVLDPDGDALWTVWTYSNGQMITERHHDGQWTINEYDVHNRIAKRITGLGNAVYGNERDARVTTWKYSMSNPRVVREEKAYENIVSRHFTVISGLQRERRIATRPGSEWDDPSNLVSLTEHFPDTAPDPADRGQLRRVINQDGTITVYDYSFMGDTRISVVDRGAPAPDRYSVVDGMRTVSVTDGKGTNTEVSTYAIQNGVPLVLETRIVTEVDGFFRPLRTEFSDGTFELRSYLGCCGLLEQLTDRKGRVTHYEYDDLDRLQRETSLDVSILTQRDASGRVIRKKRISADSTEQIVFEADYDLAGRVIASRTPGPFLDGTLVETTTSYAYPTDGGSVTTETDPTGGTRIETRYADGRIAEVSGTATSEVRYLYGSVDNHSLTNANGVQFSAHGEWSRVIRVGNNGSLEEWTTRYRDWAGRELAVEHADGSVRHSLYNESGQLVSTVDPDGVIQLYAYNARGERVLSAVDMDSDSVIDLDGPDQVTRTLSEYVDSPARGGVIRRVTTEVFAHENSDQATVVSIQESMADSNEAWVIESGRESHRYETLKGGGDWDVVVENPDGTSQVQVYVGGRLYRKEFWSASDALVTSDQYAYDGWNRVSIVTDGRTGDTTFEYFDNDQVRQVTEPDPDGGAGPLSPLVTSYEYDAMGRVTATTLPDGSTVHNRYTLRGELEKTWGSQTVPVEYTYDAQGRQQTMTTWQEFDQSTGQGVSGAAVTTWFYDSQRGWLDRKEYPAGSPASAGATDYTYTPAGRLETRTWQRGVVTTYRYDNAGNQESIDYSDSTPDVSYTYTRTGQLKTVTDATGTRVMDHDTDLRLTSEILDSAYYDGRILTRLYEDGTNGIVPGRSAGFELGILGDPDEDLSVGYTYDNAGRLSTVSDGGDTFVYGYLPHSGSLVETMTGAAHTATWSYEPGRNAVTVVENAETVGTPSTVSKFTYRYNELGQRTDRVDEGSAFAQAALYNWSYDGLGQLTAAERYLGTDPDNPGASVPAEDAVFDYDFIGNRLTSTFGTDLERVYSPDLLNQYTSVTNPSTSPTHDADGNMTYNGAGWWFDWNGENRMVEARNYPDTLSVTSGSIRLTFVYDYLGRRVEKRSESYDGTAWTTNSHQRFVYDGWNLIATFDVQSSGFTLQTSYLWGLDLSGSLQGAHSTGSGLAAGGVGGLLSITRNDEPGTPNFYATFDANGNVSEYLDDTGAIEAHFEYSAFGRVIHSTGSPDAFAFRFSTKYQDTETGLLYYGFRYYDPVTGRWLSRDPIGERGGLNLYGFVGNEPVGRWDVLGLYKLRFINTYSGFDLTLEWGVVRVKDWTEDEERIIREGQIQAERALATAISQLKVLMSDLPQMYIKNQAYLDYRFVIRDTMNGLEAIRRGLSGDEKLSLRRFRSRRDTYIVGKGTGSIYVGSTSVKNIQEALEMLVDEASHKEWFTTDADASNVKDFPLWDRWYGDIATASFAEKDLKSYVDRRMSQQIRSDFSRGLRDDELCPLMDSEDE